MSMTREEMEEFLSQGHIARIATVKQDGSPHVVPVWFLWEGGELIIVTYPNSVKIRNIKRDNRVTVVIDVPDPGKGVIMEGTARLSNDGVKEMTHKISAKYMKPEELDDYVESVLKTPMVVIRVAPKKLITWDYSKEE